MDALPLLLLLAASAAPPPAADGARAFQRCYACHSVDPKEQDLPGPNLSGVVGRRAGALQGFAYSPAMRAAGARGLTWTSETLDRFLADPEAVVPGTEMFIPAMRSPADRAAVIEYLKAASGGR